MSVVDLREELERADWSIGTSRKTSGTVHWPAAKEPIGDPVGALLGYAAYHASKDWSPEAGVQGGDGIQYARAVDQAGTRYILRDLDAVLWHSDNAHGNAFSVPYLAMVAIDEEPSEALLRGLRAQIEEDGLAGEVHPHGPTWTRTACPGPAMRSWVERGMPVSKEEEMDIAELRRIIREEIAAYAKEARETGFEPLKKALAETDDRVDRMAAGLVAAAAAATAAGTPS